MATGAGVVHVSESNGADRRRRRIRAFSQLLALIVTVAGLSAIAGWIFDVATLRSISPNLSSMEWNTATCFVALGVAVLLDARCPEARWSRNVQRGGCAFVGLVGGATLLEYATHWNLGIDRLFVSDAVSTVLPGRMSPITAVLFVGLATSAAMLGAETRVSRLLRERLVIVCGVTAVFVVIGYAYDAKQFYDLGALTSVALNSGLAFVGLGSALLCARPDQGVVALVTADGLGARMARRTLPVAVIVPTVLGWARLEAQDRGWIGVDPGVAIVVLGCTALISLVVLLNAEWLQQSDRERTALNHELEDRVARRTQEVAASEQRYRGIVDNAVAGIMQTSLDGEILTANPAAARILGYESADELLGLAHNAREFFENPFDPDEIVAGVVSGGSSDFELRIRRRDGSFIQALTSNTPLLDANGAVVRFQGMFYDISARHAVQQARSSLASVVASSDAAIYTVGDDHVIKSWNDAASRLYGYSADETIGSRIEDLFAGSADNSAGALLARVLAGERLGDIETERRAKNGRLIPVRIAESPVLDANGVVVGASSVAHDISEQRRTEARFRAQAEELARSNAELEQFAYVISHDLQQPLRTVTNYVELLQREAGARLGPDADKLIQRVMEGSDRMQELIGDLLAYARAGGADTRFAPVDCEQVLDWALDDLALAIEESGAHVTRDPLPMVIGDGVQLTQLFENLLGNAIKFSGDTAPEIHIGVEHTGQRWSISVRDQGIGFEPRFIERIFRPFKRLHTRDEYPGNGIGLAVCLKISERHGGTLVAASEPGRGSMFSVTLLPSGDDQRATSSPIATNSVSS